MPMPLSWPPSTHTSPNVLFFIDWNIQSELDGRVPAEHPGEHQLQDGGCGGRPGSSGSLSGAKEKVPELPWWPGWGRAGQQLQPGEADSQCCPSQEAASRDTAQWNQVEERRGEKIIITTLHLHDYLPVFITVSIHIILGYHCGLIISDEWQHYWTTCTWS